MDGPPLTTQAHRLDRQALEAPSKGPIEQRIQRYLTALPGTFDPMPAPAQLEYVGQGSASQAPLMVDELTGKHSDEHDADKISGASRQSANQVVNSTSSQVHWLRGQMKRGIGWFRHPPSLSELWPPLLLLW